MKYDYDFPKNGYVDAALNIGHQLVGVAVYFGKYYAWMTDPTGRHYLVSRPFEV